MARGLGRLQESGHMSRLVNTQVLTTMADPTSIEG